LAVMPSSVWSSFEQKWSRVCSRVSRVSRVRVEYVKYVE
jgi:hypothetical protein